MVSNDSGSPRLGPLLAVLTIKPWPERRDTAGENRIFEFLVESTHLQSTDELVISQVLGDRFYLIWITDFLRC